MEYLAGGSLLGLMKGEKLSEIQIAAILSSILKALNYLHTKGIIHRDIKGTVASS